jgi:hypothetical protein
MSTGFLRVHGDQVVGDDGKSIILRGAGLGGWMKLVTPWSSGVHIADQISSMENFITGYPGHESQHRAAMLKVLGKERYDFFFDKFLEYFFTEADAKFFASKGLNSLRVPFNYRHLEDDMNPRVLKEQGFKHLDRVVELVRHLYLGYLSVCLTVSVRKRKDLHDSGHAYCSGRTKP